MMHGQNNTKVYMVTGKSVVTLVTKVNTITRENTETLTSSLIRTTKGKSGLACM
jgi:hypothetical protein